MSNRFENLSEEELIEILNNGNLSEEEFVEFVAAMQTRGLRGSIMAVDDPNSEEAMAATEYIEYHQKLPESYYGNMPEYEIKWAKEILLSDRGIEEKKRAIVILAHTGRSDAYKVLEEYEKAPDKELKIWANMAIDECKSFLKSDILDEPQVSISRVTKVGRYDLCPCGSGKIYKNCCLKK